jgi:membrane-bound lytic murein transglycosylase D
MRKPVLLTLCLAVVLAGPAAAQPTSRAQHPDVPAELDVAGVHLVLNEAAQRLVQQRADGLCRHQPSFQARVDMADAAFPIIDRVLSEEGVPLDFRYLALQESALLGNAQSPHMAVGYWQLKRETAVDMGLVVNDDVDERKHLVASTRAAARFLGRNNAILHNWVNSLLSYNTGLSGVQPYTLRTDIGATEMAITEATSPYVLMFLAQKIAFEPACGQNPRPKLILKEFPAVPGQSLQAQASTLHVDSVDLAAHNYWLLAPIVPVDRAYTLVVPVGDLTQAAGIAANQRLQSSRELLALPAVGTNAAEVRVNNLRAIVALPGETTDDLARRGNKKLGDFLHDNEMTAFDMAVPGRPYYLESKRDEGAVEYHVLQPYETLFDVSQKYGIRKKAILTKNRMARMEELRPGRVLWLKHVRPREVAVEYRSLTDGVALERTGQRTAPTEKATAIQAAAVIAARQDAAIDKVNSRPAQSTEDKDGWGEALATAKAASSVEATPRPARVAVAPPVVAQLPPPAAAPAPAPLADEPAPSAAAPEPAVSQPREVSAPVAVVKPVIAPEKLSLPAPRPVAPAVVRPAVLAPRPTVVPSAPAAWAGAEARHRVAPGEGVYSIARLYQIPPATLMALNGLTPASSLKVGQVLVLKAPVVQPAPSAVAEKPAPTLKPMYRQPGRVNPALYVPKKVTSASPATTGAAPQHTVVKGETLFSISRLYKVSVADLQAWNAKPDQKVKVGDVLRVQAGDK